MSWWAVTAVAVSFVVDAALLLWFWVNRKVLQ